MQGSYNRLTQCSVTLFIHHGDDYLFLKRSLSKQVDAGRLNGVGGRLEPGEDFLSAAVRECEEETGYKVDLSSIKLAGVVKVEGGYSDDWVMCFFKIAVESKEIPVGHFTSDGELLWLKKDEVLNQKFELVDDLYYCFNDVVLGKNLFFATYTLNSDEKVISISRGDLQR